MIKIFKTGPHGHRTPLSYPALAPLFQDTLRLAATPAEADLHVLAHVLDIETAPLQLIEDWRARQRPVLLLSEEPFWETIWLNRPLTRDLAIDTRYGALPVVQLNHHTSDIYDFDRIPYYLLTNPRFQQAYGAMFTRNAQLSAQDWAARFAARPVDVAFMFERRPEPYHDRRWPEAGIIGLCAWRTRLAEACTAGVIERLGQSWQGGPTRFELSNWHSDKLDQLDGRARIIGALENTHQPLYLTEKLFDAFACGALPLYFAAPDHAVHRLGLPANAWLNLYDLPPEAAADAVAAFRFDGAFFEAFAEAQRKLAALFTDPGTWQAEHDRLAGAVKSALNGVLNGAGLQP